jgi:Lrp/AsnC family transcriptional regulator
VRLNPALAGLGLTVFVMVRTRHHSREWLDTFRRAVIAIPNVIDFYRIAGDYDYMLKVMAEDMNAYDQIYQQLIEKIELDAVTSYITMEAIADRRNLPV